MIGTIWPIAAQFLFFSCYNNLPLCTDTSYSAYVINTQMRGFKTELSQAFSVIL